MTVSFALDFFFSFFLETNKGEPLLPDGQNNTGVSQVWPAPQDADMTQLQLSPEAKIGPRSYQFPTGAFLHPLHEDPTAAPLNPKLFLVGLGLHRISFALGQRLSPCNTPIIH
jgi:hypothetical protein